MRRSKPRSSARRARVSISRAEVWVTCAPMSHWPLASSAVTSMTFMRSSRVRLQNSPMPQVQPAPRTPRARVWRML